MVKGHIGCLLIYFFNIMSFYPPLNPDTQIQGARACGRGFIWDNFCWSFLPMQTALRTIRHPTLAKRYLVFNHLSGL